MASGIKRVYWAARGWASDRPSKRVRRAHARAERKAFAVRVAQEPMVHARAAAGWLMGAQDATADDGVAAEYLVGYGRWRSSFPETTGYIIETLLDFSELDDRPELADRAWRMADWLCAVQLDEGGIQSGFIDTLPAKPTIFNTGQVMFGWMAALGRRSNRDWEAALEKAGRWLCRVQDDDGCWRQCGSQFVRTGMVNTYNVRVGWALIAAGQLLDDSTFLEAGRANLDWALGQESSAGFFENNDFIRPAAPIVHTIAYTARGFLEGGTLLGRDDYVEAAGRVAEGVARAQQADGSVPGRLDRRFEAGCRSCCLTGMAQMGLIWSRLDRYQDQRRYERAIEGVATFLGRAQSLDHPDPGVRGGIAGSHPIGGDYAPYAYPNWAAKFFLDLMMVRMPVAESSSPTLQPAGCS